MTAILMFEIVSVILFFVIGLAGLITWSSLEWSKLKEYKNYTLRDKIENNTFKIDFKVIIAVVLYLASFGVIGTLFVTIELQIALFVTLLIIALLAIVMFVIFTFIKLRYTFKMKNQ